MKVIKITPQGYCHGVVKALNILTKTIKDPNVIKPIYILGDIVHNKFITNYLKNHNIITLNIKGKSRLELLDYIDKGTVIFSAHGVSEKVREKAKKKKLNIIDAVCSDVKKTHQLIKNKIKEGYLIFYIGKKYHPETEGIIDGDRDRIFLIENENDLHKYNNFKYAKILITNQTTLSLWDVAKISNDILKKFPNSDFIKEICNATQLRQEAVVNQAKKVDLLFVVGDKKSNNTNKLVQIARENNINAYRIESVNDINIEILKNKKEIAVTSGASTPIKITDMVIKYLENFSYDDKKTWDKKFYTANIDVIPQLKGYKLK